MIPVVSHLDFEKKSQVINITLHKVSALPAGWAGGLVYLTAQDGTYDPNKVYYYNGTEWIAISDTTGIITVIEAGGGILVTGTGNTRKITLDPDDTTVELSDATDAAVIRVKDKGITFAKIQDIPSMTVIGNIAKTSGVSNGITILTDLDVIIELHDSVASAKAIKEYVDTKITSLGSMQGGWDASTETLFPIRDDDEPAQKGDYWYVTAQGTIQEVDFNVGDVIIANTDSPVRTTVTDWTFLETNRDQATTTILGLVKLAKPAEAQAMVNTEKVLTPSHLSDVKASEAETQVVYTSASAFRFVTPKGLASRTATEERTGIAEIATQDEVNAGTDDTRIVTPAKLKVYVEDYVGTYGVFYANIGNGVATQYVVTHSLDSRDVLTEVYSNSTYKTVLADVERNDVDNVTVTFSDAPSTNAYRIVIKK